MLIRLYTAMDIGDKEKEKKKPVITLPCSHHARSVPVGGRCHELERHETR
jgi:hypothetical protein